MISASRVFRAAALSTKITLNWNDQLRNNWQDLVATLLQQVVHSQNSETSVWVDLFPAAVNEDWQVVVVVKVLYGNFPYQFKA